MDEKKIEYNDPFDVAATKILDKQSEVIEPNLAKCLIAVGYAVLALVRCHEAFIDDTIHNGLHDIKEAINSIK